MGRGRSSGHSLNLPVLKTIPGGGWRRYLGCIATQAPAAGCLFTIPSAPQHWIPRSLAGDLVGSGPTLFSLPALPRLGAGQIWSGSGKLSGRPLQPQPV